MIAKADKDIFEKQVRQLFYHLKYRDTDSKDAGVIFKWLKYWKDSLS